MIRPKIFLRFFSCITTIFILSFYSGCDDSNSGSLVNDEEVDIELSDSNDLNKSVFSPIFNTIFPVAENVTAAENIIKTSEGRIFITGGTHISEYSQAGGLQVVYYDSTSYNMGMAQVGNYLYVVSLTLNDPAVLPTDMAKYYRDGLLRAFLEYFTDALMSKRLLRADLTRNPLEFEVVHVFNDMVLPNGMAADSSGNLYVADLSYLPVGGIMKLKQTSSSPVSFSEEKWLSPLQGALAPDGIKIKDNVLYFTDMDLLTYTSYLKKVSIINGKPGIVSVIAQAYTLYDDFDIYEKCGLNGFIVADFINSRIVFIDKYTGITYPVTNCAAFDSPSSVLCNATPEFGSDVVLVIEKGSMIDPESEAGHALTGVRIPCF